MANHIRDVVDLLIQYTSLGKMQDTCLTELRTLTDEFAKGNIQPTDSVCSMSSMCVGQLVQAIQEMPIVGQSVPDGTGLLIAAVCPLLQQPDQMLTLIMLPGGLLDQLPVLLPILGEITKLDTYVDEDTGKVTDCQAKLVAASKLPHAGADGTWQKIIPCHIGACVTTLIKSAYKLPLVGDALREGIKDYEMIIGQITQMPCRTKAPTGGDKEEEGDDQTQQQQQATKSPSGKKEETNFVLIGGAAAGGCLLIGAAGLIAFLVKKKKRQAALRASAQFNRMSNSLSVSSGQDVTRKTESGDEDSMLPVSPA